MGLGLAKEATSAASSPGRRYTTPNPSSKEEGQKDRYFASCGNAALNAATLGLSQLTIYGWFGFLS